jgi:hypothetical protein
MAITRRTPEVYEIFEQIKTAKNKNERVEILKAHSEHWSMRDVLQGTFDDAVQWNLPDGNAPYQPNTAESPPATLRKQHMKLKYFVKGLATSENLNKIRRERMFIELLEAVHPEDAKILASMINKKSPVKGLTKKLIQEALPGLIP